MKVFLSLLLLVLVFFTFTPSLRGQACSSDDFGTVTYTPDYSTFPGSVYPAGTAVEICFITDNYVPTGSEFLHSVIPLSVGSGFDFSSLTPGTPPAASCSNGGVWGWYPSWTRCVPGCQTTFGPGYAFDSPQGTNDPGSNCNSPAVLDGNPGNNWGDGGVSGGGGVNCTSSGLVFCFNLITVDAAGQCPGEAYNFILEINPDGETGGYSGGNPCNSPCQDDANVCFPEIEDPLTQLLNDPCPGENFRIEGSFSSGACNVIVTWENASGVVVGTDPILEINVPGTYTFGVSNGSGCRTISDAITVNYTTINPTISPDPGDSYCFGETVTLVATGGTGYRWRNPAGMIVSTSATHTFTATPALAGTYTVEVLYGTGNSCFETLTTTITVSPQITATITDNGPVCQMDDITFTATSGAGSFPAGTTFTWNNAPDGSTHTITTGPAGILQMRLEVTLPSGCSQVFFHSYEVWERPTVMIAPASAELCPDGSVTLTSTVTGGQPPYTYLWGPENTFTTSTLLINASSTQTTELYLEVTDANGCNNFSNFADITFLPSLSPVTFGACNSSTVNEILFSWNDVGQDGFEVYIRIGSGTEMLVSNNYTGLSYLLTGLLPEQSATIRVVPFNNSASGRCLGPTNSITCTTPACQNPGWIFDAIDPICVTTAGQPYDFFLNTFANGSIILNSSTLGLVNQPAGSFGTTTLSLPALAPGVTSFVHQVSASFLYPNGTCPYDTVFNIPVVGAANADLTTPLAQVCANAADVIFSLVNAYDPNATYTLSIDNPAGTTILRNEPQNRLFEVRFSQFRTYQVTLTTVSTSNPGCGDSFTTSFTLVQPPALPTVTCAEQGLDSVAFSWNDVGADAYTVNEISIPAGATTERTPLGFIVRNLNAGDAVTISVTANTMGCAPVTSLPVECVAQSCAAITPVITTPSGTFCSDGSATPVALSANVPPAGSIQWSGPGVTGSSFDPAAAGPGVHTVTLVYTEGTCTYPATIQFTVLAPPSASFSASSSAVCAGDEVTFTYTGGDPTGLAFGWAIPQGATLVSGDANSVGPIVIRFDDPGMPIVGLAVVGTACPSQASTAPITVSAPATAPTIDCENVSFDRVGFAWSHPSSSTFMVNIISQPAGATITQTANSLLATGLNEGEAVTIEVIAVNGGPCGNSAPTTLTCTAQSCPPITLDLVPVGPFCAGQDTTVVLQPNVMGSDGSGSLSWLQTDGSTLGTFNPSGIAPGIHQVFATFSEGGCTFRDTIDVTINALPASTFNLPDGPICTDEVVGADAGAAQVGWSYAWEVPASDATVTDGVDDAAIDVSWSSPGRKYVRLVITDDDGCSGTVAIDSIDVVAPLLPPVVTCGPNSLSSVSFRWDPQPGVATYEVSVDGQPGTLQDSTGLTISGLNEGDMVSITVIAIGAAPCGNSAASAPVSCTASSCPTITVTPPADADFCLGAAGNVVTLSATQSGGVGGGNFAFTGNGVTNNAGVFTFDAAAAGLGSHPIQVIYNELTCADTAVFTYTVLAPPTSDFTLNGGGTDITVCTGEDILLAYAGDLPQAASGTFSWDFASATATALAGYESYTLNFASAGTFAIMLTVEGNGCTSSLSQLNITVEDPLPAPNPTCSAADRNSVTITWPAVAGATGYLIDNGDMLPAGQTSYTRSGLLPGETATMTVTALGSGACGNSPASVAVSCQAEACPPFTLDRTGVADQVCLLNGNETLDLSTVLVTGGNGNGATYTFSGPGVSGTTFDAAAAGGSEAGTTHTINVTYSEEGPCDFTGTFEVIVFARPSVLITLSDPACVGEAVSVVISSGNPIGNADITV
ncbi:hypothetical protein H9S92_17575, partial [Lewinella lacunae]